jgi:hypothetical protein
MFRTIALIAVVALLAAESQPTAREQLAVLRRQAHAARQSGDKVGYLQAALKAQALLNGSPDAVESVALAYAEAGDATHALDSLTTFASMGQVDQSLIDVSNKAFAPLRDSPRFTELLQQFQRNKAPVSHADPAFALSDAGLVAEDIDYDPQSKTFLITSVLQKKIIRVNTSGASTDFASSPSGWPMLAIKIDSARKLVWATEVALDGFAVVPETNWGRSAVLCIDLASGKILRRFEAPPHAALGDLVLAANGDPIVSDGALGGVYRVVRDKLELINGGDFISPQTPATLPDGSHFLVPDYLRGIGLLDLRGGKIEWLTQDANAHTAINGVDGLYFSNGSLVVTQNGTSPERVIRLSLDRSLKRVVSSQIIEQATPTLGDPTHGVLVGNSFYYIANSGWSELDDHGNLKPGSKLTPARIMRFMVR